MDNECEQVATGAEYVSHHRQLKITLNDESEHLLSSICENRISRKGSPNVAFSHNGESWGMHRPHPDKGLKPPYIQQIRAFLTDSGLKEEIEAEDD
ncbi:MAG: hypothetical protein AAGL17_10760 [Cyanobacteria bacterium J06576_12]